MVNVNKKILRIVAPIALVGALMVVIIMHFFDDYILNNIVNVIQEHGPIIESAVYLIDIFVFFLTAFATSIFLWITLFRFRRFVEKDIETYLLAIESATNHIVITDRDGIIFYANKSAENITGYTREEMMGNTPRLWGALMPADFYKDLWQTIKYGRRPFYGEIRNRRKNQDEYYAFVRISPIIDRGGSLLGFVTTEEDITDRKEIDREKSEFISVASHQLRTPLTGIQWVVERFTKKEKLTPKGKEYLDDIHASVKRLTQLVDLLLNLSRIEAGKVGTTLGPLEAIGFVQSYLNECAPLFEKRELTLVFKDHPAECTVTTDKSVLRNIVQSLISNAIEYTLPGGAVEVAVRKENDTFMINVRDTGIGIPRAEQAHIFEKFARASNAKLYKTDGTGIGLYIAKWATALLGGKIWFESEENKGSSFSVELPLRSAAKAGERPLA